MDIEKQLLDCIKNVKFKVTINELQNKDDLINILKDKEAEMTFEEISRLSALLEKKRIINR